MSNIVGAIELENRYLEHRKNGEEPFHLIDAVRDCGFETLEQYFAKKREYQFDGLDMTYIERTPAECMAEVFSMISNKVVGALFVDTDETFVFKGISDKRFNESYCAEHNIPVYEIRTRGGSIVSVRGDFSLGICVPKSINVDDKFMLENISKILSKHTEGVVVDGNDILIRGNKVCGSASYSKNSVFMWVAHFSFADSSELIEVLCAADNTAKTPSYITVPSREEFRREVKEWLHLQ